MHGDGCEPAIERRAPQRRPVRGYAAGKGDYLTRLRKIEGQIRGLERMVDEDAYCPDVIVQVASAIRALQEVAVGLVADHARHCVVHAMHASDEDGDASRAELAGAVRQLVRL